MLGHSPSQLVEGEESGGASAPEGGCEKRWRGNGEQQPALQLAPHSRFSRLLSRVPAAPWCRGHPRLCCGEEKLGRHSPAFAAASAAKVLRYRVRRVRGSAAGRNRSSIPSG